MGMFGSGALAEAISLVVYSVVAAVLTIGGLFVEYTSVQYLGTGEQVVAFWLAAIGAVLLYAGLYGIGYKKLLARVS
ncbi:hypothetical protein OB955_06565 [Halobacteria archaeon AArc-m2/3/4]|uniref:DUF8151 domain-containing protein n=1 Tax=Natronoglomus mannanivorans TaxID=2979990 RepID=A0ABT2QBW3_9EURY|nr:hypothetical protein [Halobacteria archaeon AArc-m2/3/4]